MSPAPIPAVIAVIVHEGQTLLVRRANPPDAGLWGFPGGKIEFGETVRAAAMRELLEETGVRAEALDIITTLDIFEHRTQKWPHFWDRLRCSFSWLAHRSSRTQRAALATRRATSVKTGSTCPHDALVPDPSGAPHQHYILIAVQCRWVSGVPAAGDDALEARWIPVAELDPSKLPMSADVDVIARRAQALIAHQERR